ncbi:hypothetical protein AJ80_09278 [Polytolypa hystricis UAMH7299]|uniref:DUF7932 domain-containing protein n=1 Tax=Polytolypa hystricis (strain UAMH7299) TaxID=1447883 RepID=A0A2B7WTF8_POLH7|nr:hypothetical protein AJ80_09278 [Polytolypa hystricis UAMH7299]
MNFQRPQFTIQVNGGDGESGDTVYPWRDASAPKHQHGLNGQAARQPGVGGPAGFLSVELTPSSLWPGGIHVEGIGSWQGESWEVETDHDLFLSAQGGHGGDGGVGENGQDGGRGRNGEDATRYSEATNGHGGKNGGSGGYGSSGANGGNGGTIEVTVAEEHMNLLVAVAWAINGGNGGSRGAHGRGGRGGPGGNGGAGCTWTVDTSITRFVDDGRGNLVPETRLETDWVSKSAGWAGSSGYDGSQPSDPLFDGAPGQNGIISFFILRRDGAREQYHGCYDLRVSGFEIVDENEDGINEPGEHIFVENIQVHNTGVMPSPSLTRIPLGMLPSEWLDGSIPQDGVLLPTSIPPGGVYEARGSMKAFIKQEPGLRQTPNNPLVVNETVDIIAIMPGVNRPLNNFTIQSAVVIQFPLQLLPPLYLRTVAIGDEFSVQWKVRNVSRKAYGTACNPNRLCGTRLHKVGQFDFKTPMDNDESFKYIEIIEPGCEAVFSEALYVDNSAEPFSRGNMCLEIFLAEPGDDPSKFSQISSSMPGVRWIAKFDLDLQISPLYKHNPDASFLLLANTGTPGSLVRELVAYIQGTLFLGVDVYNISISGNLMDMNTNESVLRGYVGKTVIILANPMDYFGQHGRFTYEFIDPWLATKLLKAGTSILLLGLGDISHLTQHWAKMVAIPEFPIDLSGTDGSFHGASVDSLLDKLGKMNIASAESLDIKSHTVTVKKSMFKSFKSSANTSGEKLAKRLSKTYPYQSYAVATDYTNASKTNPARVIVREGLSSSVKVLASSIPCQVEVTYLPGAFEYLIAATLPFEQRLAMLWTGASSTETSTGAMGDQISSSSSSVLRLPEKVLRLLALSLKYDLLQETSNFCSKAPLRDPASKLDVKVLLPLLTKLFSCAKGLRADSKGTPESQESLTSIVIWLLAEANPKFLSKASGRKRIVKDYIKANMSSIISQNPTSSFDNILKQQLPQVLKTTKQIGSASSDQPPVVSATLSDISAAVGTSNQYAIFHDIGRLMNKSCPTFFWAEQEHLRALSTYSTFMQRIAADEARSAGMISNVIMGSVTPLTPPGSNTQS